MNTIPAIILLCLFLGLIHTILRMMVTDMLTGVRSMSRATIQGGLFSESTTQKIRKTARVPVLNSLIVLFLAATLFVLCCSLPLRLIATK